MCGICGIYRLLPSPEIGGSVSEMVMSLAHRGPDGRDVWTDTVVGVGLGHTRLSVIDLQGGAQPMLDATDSAVIVFNGEVYNFLALRQELEARGRRFRTHSDTEVVLNAYLEWGMEALPRFHGMFALAIWDRRDRSLLLARDKVGIKPLYVYEGARGFAFASELKALLAIPSVTRRVDRRAIIEFLVLGYPLHPRTCFSDLKELPPGSWLCLREGVVTKGRYWSWRRDEDEYESAAAVGETDQVLRDCVKEHLLADVPVGAFLSGGIDSSLLVAYMSEELGEGPRTFTVRFPDAEYDESKYARLVAKRFRTIHHELFLESASGGIDKIGRIVDQFDQPFADSSALPTYYICREIRKHVKVVIGGDGGDEMFGGYERFWYADVARMLGNLHPVVLIGGHIAARGIRFLSPDAARQFDRFCTAGETRDVRRLLALSWYMSPEEAYRVVREGVADEWGEHIPDLMNNGTAPDPGGAEFMDATIRSALPGDYLRKIDVMSSAHGLEVRVPFLGDQVLNLCRRLPGRLKYRTNRNKLILRALARSRLPAEVARKPKWGFGIPLDVWLGPDGRGAIRDEIRGSARISDLIRPEYLGKLLNGFVDGEWNHLDWSRFGVYQRSYSMWSLQRWLDRWRPTL